LTLETAPAALAKSLAAKHRLRIISLSDPGQNPGSILQRLEQLQAALETCQQQATVMPESE